MRNAVKTARRACILACLAALPMERGAATQTAASDPPAATEPAKAENEPSLPSLRLPRGRPLTEAQKRAAALPARTLGGRFPVPALAPDAPMPSADPRDLGGTWYHDQNLELRMQTDMYGEPTPFTMAGVEVLARRVNAKAKGTPYKNAAALCLPPGQPLQLDLNFPFQIFQSKNWIEVVLQEFHARWKVAYDPSFLPASAEKPYMGRSVGHWNGDVLTVETSGYKKGFWLDADGTPLSADGRLVQRIRKVDDGDRRPFLEIITTVHDPIYYTRPWSFVRLYAWYPDQTLFKEYNCEEQLGDKSSDANAGLIPEPEN